MDRRQALMDADHDHGQEGPAQDEARHSAAGADGFRRGIADGFRQIATHGLAEEEGDKSRNDDD